MSVKGETHWEGRRCEGGGAGSYAMPVAGLYGGSQEGLTKDLCCQTWSAALA